MSKQKLLDSPVTVVLLAVFIVASTAGAAVTIINPATLSFEKYLTDLSIFAGSLGLLGIGRGIKAAAASQPVAGADPVVIKTYIDGKKVAQAVAAVAGENTIVTDQAAPDLGSGEPDEPGDHFPALAHIPLADPLKIVPDLVDVPTADLRS